MLNWVEIRAVWRPKVKPMDVCLNSLPLLCTGTTCMGSSPVVLEDKLLLVVFSQLIDVSKEMLLQKGLVIISVKYAINLSKRAETIRPKAAPNHDISISVFLLSSDMLLMISLSFLKTRASESLPMRLYLDSSDQMTCFH